MRRRPSSPSLEISLMRSEITVMSCMMIVALMKGFRPIATRLKLERPPPEKRSSSPSWGCELKSWDSAAWLAPGIATLAKSRNTMSIPNVNGILLRSSGSRRALANDWIRFTARSQIRPVATAVNEADQRNAAGLNQPPIDCVEPNPVHLGDHPRAVRVDGLHVCDVAVTALPGDHDRARPRSPSGREAHGLGVSVPRPRVTLPGDLPAGGGRRRGAARGGTGFPPRPDGWDRAADPAATPPENDGATPTL